MKSLIIDLHQMEEFKGLMKIFKRSPYISYKEIPKVIERLGHRQYVSYKRYLKKLEFPYLHFPDGLRN